MTRPLAAIAHADSPSRRWPSARWRPRCWRWPLLPPPASRSGRCSRTTCSSCGPALRCASRRSTRSRRLGADTLRIEVKWSEVAPSPGSKSKPAFDATDPAAYPGFQPYDDLVQRAVAQGLPDHDHARARCPQLGDSGRTRRQLQGRLEGLRGLRAGGRAPLLGRVRRPPGGEVLLDLERAEPHLLPQAPLAGAARVPAARRARRPGAARRGRARGHRIFVGELAPVGTATVSRPGTA